MVILKERIRRLEDASTKAPQAGVDLVDRVALMRGMVRAGRRRADLSAKELSLYDAFVPLAKSVFDCPPQICALGSRESATSSWAPNTPMNP
jgi:hypothetical protein